MMNKYRRLEQVLDTSPELMEEMVITYNLLNIKPDFILDKVYMGRRNAVVHEYPITYKQFDKLYQQTARFMEVQQ